MLTLSRASNLPTVWTNCLAAWVVNASTSQSLRVMPITSELSFLDQRTFLFLLAGASLIYAGGCTLNDAIDQNFDARCNPLRPIPSGLISASSVWTLGILEMGLGAWAMIEGAQCSPKWIILLLLSVFLYNWLHKRWVGSFALMGGCRFFLWMGAASAGNLTHVTPQTLLWGLVLGAYVMGISLYAREESRERKNPKSIAIFFLLAPPLTSLAGLILWNNLDPIRIFLINLIGLLAAWIAFCSILEMKTLNKESFKTGISRLLAGICAIDAIALCFVSPMLAGFSLLGVCFAQVLQKKFAAT